MKRKILLTGVVLPAFFALILSGLLPGFTARAATEDTGDIGFYVRALLPENQADTSLTYFDLRMQPGQKQTLEVEVVNETDSEITVDIDAISASTNRNDIIDYKTPNIRDITLAHPFSELARVEESTLRVPAQAGATARIGIEMPAQEYDGVVLGGLVFTRRDQAPPQDGTTLQNLYSYVVGVKLNETDAAVAPDFELERVQGESVNYQAALVHYIRNKNAAIAKDINLSVVLRDAAGQVVGEAQRTGIDMAPNSTMPLAVTPLPPSGGNGASGQSTGEAELLPGDYTSKVTLEHGGQSWAFEQKFTIGSVDAQNINAQTIGAAEPNAPFQTGTLLVILLGVAGAIIIGLFLIIFLMLRRREETKELNRLMRRRREQLRAQQERREHF